MSVIERGDNLIEVLATAGEMCIRDRSQTARDKLGSQKGKSPDHRLRSQSAC